MGGGSLNKVKSIKPSMPKFQKLRKNKIFISTSALSDHHNMPDSSNHPDIMSKSMEESSSNQLKQSKSIEQLNRTSNTNLTNVNRRYSNVSNYSNKLFNLKQGSKNKTPKTAIHNSKVHRKSIDVLSNQLSNFNQKLTHLTTHNANRRKSLSGHSSISNSSGIDTISSSGSANNYASSIDISRKMSISEESNSQILSTNFTTSKQKKLTNLTNMLNNFTLDSSKKSSSNKNNSLSNLQLELGGINENSCPSGSSLLSSGCSTPINNSNNGAVTALGLNLGLINIRQRSHSLCVKNGISLTLEFVIEDKNYKTLFFNFLCSEHSEETLQFILSVKKLLHLSQSKILSLLQLKSKAKNVYDTYVKEGSEREINLLYKTRSLVSENLKLALLEKNSAKANNDIPMAFMPAKEEIMALLRRDSFPRFLKTQA